MDLLVTEKLIQVSLQHLHDEFTKMQVGRASTAMVEGILVDAYGTSQPLRNLATITTPDARSISIQPWDKAVLSAIEKSIRDHSGLGLNPMNDGHLIRLNIPQPTEERRKELVKFAHAKGEETKVSIRSSRQKAHSAIHDEQKAKVISEDHAKVEDKKLQEQVDAANAKVDAMVKAKEKEILTI